MKHQLHFLSIFLFLLASTFSSAQITFKKTFGGTTSDGGNCVQQTYDGGYIIAGYTTNDTSHLRIALLKTDDLGNITWQKAIDASPKDDVAFSVAQTFDSAYIVAGCITKSSNDHRPYLARFNAIGDTVWSHDFGGGHEELLYAVQQTIEGNIVSAGYYDAGWSQWYPLILISDTDGSTLSVNYPYIGHMPYAYDVKQTSDGGFIYAGNCIGPSVSNIDLFYIKTDSAGAWVWIKKIQTQKSESCNSVLQTNDGGYMLAGYSNYPNGGSDYDFYLVKTDVNGDTLWTKKYGGANDDEAKSVAQTSDGGFILAGFTNSTGAGGYDVYLVKTDSAGVVQWTKTFGGTQDDKGNFVRQTTDGGYIIAGTTSSFGLGGNDIFLIKTDSNGNVACNPNPVITPSNLILCPNESGTLSTDEFETYQWYKDAAIIPGATNQSLSVDQNDAGSYFSVTVTEDTCVAQSPSVLVDGYVFLPPYVIQSGDQGYYDYNLGAIILCTGDTLILTLGQPYTENIHWYDSSALISGATSSDFYVTQTGSYTACGTPQICPSYVACLGLNINVIVGNPIAVITQSGDTLFSAAASSYQWFLAGNIIPGATNQFYVPLVDGDYTVSVTDQFNCTALSSVYQFINTGISVVSFSENDFVISTFENEINISSKITTIDKILLQDVSGKIILDEDAHDAKSFSIPTTQLSSGIYLLEVFSEGRMNAFKLFIPKK